MKILFASAEFAPIARVGGMAEATSGLVHALRDAGVDVEVVVPDYFNTPLSDETQATLEVPHWAAPAVARTGMAEGTGRITLVTVPGIERPNPYVDGDGDPWPDNAERFFAFSAAVAALAEKSDHDVVHCNDWHTALTLGLLKSPVASVMTLHNVAYQGWTSGGWLERLGHNADAFAAHGGTNPLAGAIALADRVIAVSPNHADEIRTVDGGSGLDAELRALGSRLIGIRNGIDTSVWNPAEDGYIAAQFGVESLDGKAACRDDLLATIGWEETDAPIVGIVSRLVGQKGIEMALEALAFADDMPFRLVLLGSGERRIADRARDIEVGQSDVLSFHDGYDVGLGHKIFAGADMLLMPSRFEPCGLAQMQAMDYGTIPVVTPVGGLVDTVIDADGDSASGTGFVARSVDEAGVVDALHRAVRAWKEPSRWADIQRRGMEADWSWKAPAAQHITVYEAAIASRRQQTTDNRQQTGPSPSVPLSRGTGEERSDDPGG